MLSNLTIGVSVDTAVTALSFVIVSAVLESDVRTACLPSGVEHVVTDLFVVCLLELCINKFDVVL